MSDGVRVVCLDSRGDVLAHHYGTNQCERLAIPFFLPVQQEFHLHFGEPAADTLGECKLGTLFGA